MTEMREVRNRLNDEQYMRMALDLAVKGRGWVSPNPVVGAVIVRDDGRVIAEGWHERYGGLHAERNALTRCKEDTKGADLYVTLEPCCHYGKTPPCTEIIIEKGIKRVFVGSMDPNPLVAGHGVEILRNHGIEVIPGVLSEECDKLNEIFMHYITNKIPFVAMKYAMTLDGKIAAYTGDSKWITGEKSREHVMYLRNKYSSILVGINTVEADNPMLNCRMEGGTDPVRVIIDSMLRISTDCQIAATANQIRTIVYYAGENENNEIEAKKLELQKLGLEVIKISGKANRGGHFLVDMEKVIKDLGQKGIDSVLVEGGGEINASLLETGLVNKVYAYIAGKLIMGRNAKSPVMGDGIPLMNDAVTLKDIKVQQLDNIDILLEGNVN